MKALFILFLLITSTNVHAENMYTDYKLIGYSETSKENTETIKYEKTFLNKFYKNVETNIVYEEKDIILEESPLIDYTDYQTTINYVKNRIFDYPCEHFVTLKSKETYKTNQIILDNFNTELAINKVFEIEIYSKEIKIPYTISNFYWLNDGILDVGEALIGENLKLTLDDFYNVEDLTIKIYYCYKDHTDSKFILEFVNEQGDNKIRQIIRLDTYFDDKKVSTINVMENQQFNDFCKNKKFVSILNLIRTSQISYFIYQKIFYKHYNIEKKLFYFV